MGLVSYWGGYSIHISKVTPNLILEGLEAILIIRTELALACFLVLNKQVLNPVYVSMRLGMNSCPFRLFMRSPLVASKIGSLSN